jgi:transcriptional regulator with XRE-family HTH domain
MEQLRPPNLGDFLRARRQALGLTREQLVLDSHVTVSYLTKLESGERRRPEAGNLAALARSLRLPPEDRQHVQDLVMADPNVGAAPPAPEAYREAVTPQLRDTLRHLSPHLGAYLDERWNVLASNDGYDAAYPGLDEQRNVLRWFFRDERSRRTMLEWEREAALTVEWFRGLMGKYGNPAWALDLLNELSSQPEFAEMWNRQHVSYGRHQPLMHLRDADTGEPYSISVQIFRLPDRPDPVQFYIGIRQPYTGLLEILDEEAKKFLVD